MLLESGGGLPPRAHPGHAPGADRRAHRPPAARREGAASPCLRDRPHLLARRDRAPRAGPRRRGGCSTICCSATSSLAEPRSTIVGERAYSFKHVLIREVAYGGLTKAERAQLHERFAEWLARAGGRGAAGDPGVPPRPRRAAPGRARRRRRRPSSPARPRLRSRRPGAARSRESRTAPRGKLLLRSVELEPTLERRYHAARAAWRMSDLPAVSIEMSAVLDGAREAGRLDGRGQGADRARRGRAAARGRPARRRRSSSTPRSRRFPRTGRFGALEVRGRIAWWVGDFETQERMVAEEALEIAQRLRTQGPGGRMRSNELSSVYRQQRPARRGGGDDAPQASSSRRRAAASSRGRRRCTRSARSIWSGARRSSASSSSRRRSRSSPRSATPGCSGALSTRSRGPPSSAATTPAAERLLREAIRLLKPLEDRGALCESQRALAEVLIRLGRLDEAERLALEAVETVGEHDISSRGDDDDVARARPRRPGQATPRRRHLLQRALTSSSSRPGSAGSRSGSSRGWRSSSASAAARRRRTAYAERCAELCAGRRPRRRLREKDRADRLTRRLVRRLRDHGRRRA